MIFYTKNKYEQGDERVKKTFLLLPKRIGNEIRWFCSAKIKQRYYAGDYYDSPMWMDISWA